MRLFFSFSFFHSSYFFFICAQQRVLSTSAHCTVFTRNRYRVRARGEGARAILLSRKRRVVRSHVRAIVHQSTELLCVQTYTRVALSRSSVYAVLQPRNYKNTIRADQPLLSPVPRPIEPDSGMPSNMIHSATVGARCCCRFRSLAA